jgi:hypothetical protein
MGLILDLNFGVRAIERFERRGGDAENQAGFPLVILSACKQARSSCSHSFRSRHSTWASSLAFRL